MYVHVCYYVHVLYMYCTCTCVLYMRGVTQSILYYVMIIISILPSHEERRDTRFHTLKETLQLQLCNYI